MIIMMMAGEGERAAPAAAEWALLEAALDRAVLRRRKRKKKKKKGGGQEEEEEVEVEVEGRERRRTVWEADAEEEAGQGALLLGLQRVFMREGAAQAAVALVQAVCRVLEQVLEQSTPQGGTGVRAAAVLLQRLRAMRVLHALFLRIRAVREFWAGSSSSSSNTSKSDATPSSSTNTPSLSTDVDASTHGGHMRILVDLCVECKLQQRAAAPAPGRMGGGGSGAAAVAAGAAVPVLYRQLLAEVLRDLEVWNLSFGVYYPRIRVACRYLTATHGVQFPDVAGQAERLRLQQLEQEKELLRSWAWRFLRCLRDYLDTDSAARHCLQQMVACFDIIVPPPPRVYGSVSASSSASAGHAQGKRQEQEGEEEEEEETWEWEDGDADAGGGIAAVAVPPSAPSARPAPGPGISAADNDEEEDDQARLAHLRPGCSVDVQLRPHLQDLETSDTKPVFDSLRELSTELKRVHIPAFRRWVAVGTHLQRVLEKRQDREPVDTALAQATQNNERGSPLTVAEIEARMREWSTFLLGADEAERRAELLGAGKLAKRRRRRKRPSHDRVEATAQSGAKQMKIRRKNR